MASWREINEVGKDPARVRRLAEQLLLIHRDELTEWERDFLDNVMGRGAEDEDLSTRQAEKLLEIRDEMKSYANIDGFNARKLIDQCWLARFDLSEEDEEFICKLRDAGCRRKSDAMRLLRCARQLSLIDRYVDLDAA